MIFYVCVCVTSHIYVYFNIGTCMEPTWEEPRRTPKQSRCASKEPFPEPHKCLRPAAGAPALTTTMPNPRASTTS